MPRSTPATAASEAASSAYAGGLLVASTVAAWLLGVALVFPNLGPSAYVLATVDDPPTRRRVVGGHAVGVAAGALAYHAITGGFAVTTCLEPGSTPPVSRDGPSLDRPSSSERRAPSDLIREAAQSSGVTTTAPFAEDGDSGIRRAERADLLAIYRIEKASFPQPWPYEVFDRFLGESGFLVAEADGAVIGYVVADVVPNHGRAFGHVKDLAVHPERRGEGWGRRLLAHALTRLAEGDATSVKLEVREGNEPARNLYEDFGFQILRRVRNYYDDGTDAFVMVRELDDWGRRDRDYGATRGNASDRD